MNAFISNKELFQALAAFTLVGKGKITAVQGIRLNPVRMAMSKEGWSG